MKNVNRAVIYVSGTEVTGAAVAIETYDVPATVQQAAVTEREDGSIVVQATLVVSAQDAAKVQVI